MTKLSGYEVDSAIRRAGMLVAGPMLDEWYGLPQTEWGRQFMASYSAIVNPLSVGEAHDCENRALRAVVLADECLLLSGERDCGHTFGIVQVLIRAGQEFLGSVGQSLRNHTLNLMLASTGVFWFWDGYAKLYEEASKYLTGGTFSSPPLVRWM